MGEVPLVGPVLDIGCGDGHFASLAYPASLPLDVGIDADAASLAEAARRRGVYRHLLHASAERLPFADGAFRTVVSNCVIEHIPDLDAALSEIARVLRTPAAGESAAWFATTVPSENFADFLLGSTLLRAVGLRGLSGAYGRFFNRISRHYHVYPLSEWKERLARAGLVLERHTDYFSAAAHRRFDASHYLGAPTLAIKLVFGRWVLFPAQGRVFERWLRPAFEEPLPAAGAYRFLLCRKAT